MSEDAPVYGPVAESKLPVSAPPGRFYWLTPSFPQIIGGVIALLGALIGAGASCYAQLHIEGQRAVQVEKQRLLDRAEEIIALIEKTPVTYLESKGAMMLESTHISTPPTDALRVTALVALYFPDASDAARSFEAACAEHSEILSEIAIQIVQGSRPFKDDSVSYQKMLGAGDVVTAKVLGDIGVLYKRRVPVVLPTDLR